ncbi:MAG: hypothetical protein WBG30_06690 [Psychrilyobacter sp.]|uniref:hypothetical protein n=1 Tax=Psychrilyobacter sp. TaxID=2586924 RepID=UPI003C72B6B3
MKKLLLGALLIIGTSCYGVSSVPTQPNVTAQLNITAKVEPSASLEIKKGGSVVTELEFDGNPQVLTLDFKGIRGGELASMHFGIRGKEGEINMQNDKYDKENFKIPVKISDNNETITLGKTSMLELKKGNYKGTLFVTADYN